MNSPLKKCNHTSVGIFVWDNQKLLLIERMHDPKGFAVPAGHVEDGEEYVNAARRELEEEVGLKSGELELIYEGRKENPCRREGGAWHNWKLYKAEVVGGELKESDETKQIGWYDAQAIKILAERAEEFKKGIISAAEWSENPGLEPVMYEFFKALKILEK